MKKIGLGSHIGDSGVALIHQMVNRMGFVWHERTGTLDAGIDGEIELRDPSTGEVANRVIFVQSKASDRPFPGENDQSFHYLCKQADIDYWMSADNPVLLICSHPQTGEAWWMHIQSWFADPSHRASGRIDFDKRTQSFDHSTSHRLLNLADPHGHAHVAVADDRQESLTSNLLKVTIPALLYRARTTITDPREVITQQQESGTADLRRDFILRRGYLHSWLPPQETTLGHVTRGATDAIETAEWASDPNRQRWLVQLLNYALQRDVNVDCDWHNGRKIVYFRATADLRQRQIRGASGRARSVFHPKFKKNKPEEISYCKHAALEWKFLQFGGEWYCALSPTFHYTRDGYRDSLFLSEYLTGIKQLDRNPAVCGHTRMWATYLKGDEGVLVPRETILTYGNLLDFTANRAIDDASWLADTRETDTDDSASKESPDADELALFEVKQ
ncbi:DUF4365 domain-containing protein [Actinomadura sp. LD22]|uniref:DUF4365 domain-containing protein n=1 Tax=Actinomadura physcomitrii TaxID=2650748 RepID=A0A6I4MFW1_9ACTN|nr:DUF4365 domain-containing protein [Actinomadura physcomitrii]MWA04573.1 DUF4365 domain-containing protein [Actinomadura physcomitrii]